MQQQEQEEQPEEPLAKKPRGAEEDQPRPEALEEGTHVLYGEGSHGVIHDAYIPLDEFWVANFETGQLVRDQSGQVVQFQASQLKLAPQQDVPKPSEDILRSAVLILGREEHMVKAIEHFGAPDCQRRHSPQQLLAIPCQLCGELDTMSADAVSLQLVALARQFRPDIHVGVRDQQVKQAVEKIGPDLMRLDGYYFLSAVQLPYSQEAIEEAGLTDWERHLRRNVCNQVDLCPTASKEHPSTEQREVAARAALGEKCCIELSDTLCEDRVQQGIRRSLGVELATTFEDASGATVFVMVLPDDAMVLNSNGVLCFIEALGVDYESGQTSKAAVPQQPEKTVRQWEQDQATEFAGLPPLQPGWLRVRSRNGEVYYFHKKTQEATFHPPEVEAHRMRRIPRGALRPPEVEGPLPQGWSKQVSKRTAKTYYFNTFTRKSTFQRPVKA